MQEIETIKEAIAEGRLWELIEVRCRGHPSLLEGLRRIGEHKSHLAYAAPSTKRKGIFIFDSTSLQRPEYVMYLERLVRDYEQPKAVTTMVLMPATRRGPKDRASKSMEGVEFGQKVHVCLYCPPYGIVPSELEDTFPFMHTEFPELPDAGTIKAMAEAIRIYLKNKPYQSLVFVHSNKPWQKRLGRMCSHTCREMGLKFSFHGRHKPSDLPIEILGNQKRYRDKTVTNKLARKKL